MPLLDHFHAELDGIFNWEAIHSAWATRIADSLNEILPANFTAIERQRFGNEIEIDVAAYELSQEERASPGNGKATALLEAPAYAPPQVHRTVAAEFPDVVEVKVFLREGGSKLVGAIELVSPSNTDRPSERQAFVAKCLTYLKDGVSLIIVDVVSNRRANLHHEIMKLLDDKEEAGHREESLLYASAFRPALRNGNPEIDIWLEPLSVGNLLPVMPLRLTGDLFVPVDLEATYMETCRRRRLC